MCLAPEGSWYPWAAPWIFFGGGYKGPGCRGHLPWPPELPAPPGPPSVCFALEAPSCVCLCVGPVGSPECPPPSLVVLLRRGTCLPGGGSYVRPLSCMSCVPASCFLIWFVSCPRFMSLWVYSVPGVWFVNYPVYLSPVFWVPCRLVYSLFPVFLCVCIALSYLDVVIKDYYFEVSPRLRVPRFFLLCAPWHKY